MEPVYQECLDIEFKLQTIPFAAQKSIALQYKGYKLQHTYEPDFVCFGDIIVEIKAVSKLADEHRAQILNYMNATSSEVGLLVNFGHDPLLEYERFINQRKKIAENVNTNLRSSAYSAGTIP